MASDKRGYVRGHFAFTLDSFNCGLVQEVKGFDVDAEVTQLPEAHNYFVRKHIQNVKYSPGTIKFGAVMGSPIHDWIQASLDMNYMRKSGAIDALDFKLESRHTIEFKDALINEITFPACDAAAKDAAFVQLGFSPEIIRRKAGSGAKMSNPVNVDQKSFTPSNFRLSIDGLEDPCKQISKVNALTVKQTAVFNQVGVLRDYEQEPGHLEYPNLEITLSEEHVQPFLDWHQSFVIDGENEEAKHRQGALEYLNLKRDKTLMTVELRNLGITKVAAAAFTNNDDKIAAYTVTMYTESLGAKFA
jgi:hypothetical protein